jgi:hypothetical protein
MRPIIKTDVVEIIETRVNRFTERLEHYLELGFYVLGPSPGIIQKVTIWPPKVEIVYYAFVSKITRQEVKENEDDI